MPRAKFLCILLLATACDSQSSPPVSPPGSPPPQPVPTTTTMSVSSTQIGADQTTFDYASTDDVFVRVKVSDSSLDGRLLRLAMSPAGGRALIVYQTQVVSSAAIFDFAVSGTLFGRNAQSGHFAFEVSDATTGKALAQRDVQFVSAGRQ
jgi:hypothetical protein